MVATNENDKKMLRILMLHGYMQNAQMFRDKTGGLRKSLKNLAEFVYCDAPHQIPKRKDAETENSPDASSATNNEDNDSNVTKGWWFKSRDFSERNQIHFKDDFEKTLIYMDDFFTKNGPFDGVWGFSMGGELATLLSKISIDNNTNMNENPAYKSINFKFLIITASKKSSETFHDSYYDLSKKFEIDSLHVIGKGDKQVPSDIALQLTDYFVQPKIYMHDAGHFIPNNSESKLAYGEFLKNFIK